MSSCVIPGSFDPVTLGHMDLIRRAAAVFDRVTVVVMVNIRKQGVFSSAERERMLKSACAGISGVRVEVWDGLLADYMRQRGERTVVRGVRSAAEYDQEALSARANRALNPETETVMIPAAEGDGWISSSAVKEIAAFGGEIRGYVPRECAEEIRIRLSNKKTDRSEINSRGSEAESRD